MSARARAVLAALLGVCAVCAGVAVWDTPHVSGGTMLAFGLAMTALWVVSPLVDVDPDVEVRRITLDEACARADRDRLVGGSRVKVTRAGRAVIIHRRSR